MALITMLVVALVGVEQGIVLAMVLPLIDRTRRGYKTRSAVLVPEESGALRTQPVASNAEAVPGLMIYRFTRGVYYVNMQQLTEEVTALVKGAEPALRWFCIDA